MRRIVFSARARRDLDEAWAYIAAENLDAAERLVGRVEQAVSQLAEMPGIGHTRTDVADRRFRFWAVKPYVIAYRYTTRAVTIVRIVHGAREMGRVFRPRRGRG